MKYIVYIGFALFALAMVLLEAFLKDKKIRFLPFAALLLGFFALAVLKSKTVGTDSYGYSVMYNEAKSKTFSEVFKENKIEIGFYGLAYLFSAILKVPEILFDIFCFALICGSLLLSFYKNENRTVYLAVFLFVGFFCMSFSGLRQSISISIATLAFTILFDDSRTKKYPSKLIKYLFLIAIASLFHRSALLLFAVPLLSLIFIDDYAIPYFPILVLLFSPLMFGRLLILSSLVTKEPSNNAVFDSRISVTLIGEVVFLILFYVLFFTQIGKKIRAKINVGDFEYAKKDSNYLLLIYLSCLFVAFNTGSTVITRISMFFFIGPAYYLVKMISTLKNKKMRIAYIGLLTLFLGLYFVYSTPTLGLTPYAFR